MRFAYQFSNLLSTVYHEGNLIFSSDGDSVISPVGNRITICDLKRNKSMTLPVESRYDYTAIDLSPNGYTLIAINEEGVAQVINMLSLLTIHKYEFDKRVAFVKFSPNGKHFAVGKGSNVFVFKAPGIETGEFYSFVMEKVLRRSSNDVTCISWSFDSKLLAVGSKDSLIQLYSLERFKNFKMYTLGSHSDSVVGCFFEANSYDIFTTSRNGHLCVWECNMDPNELVSFQPPVKKSKRNTESDAEDNVDLDRAIEQPNNKTRPNVRSSSAQKAVIFRGKLGRRERFHYKRLARHYLADEVRKDAKDAVLTAATYHAATRIFVAGFSNGAFSLYEMPEVNAIHSLSIANQRISSIAINSSGDWIALGCSKLGQLLVWEWQSETYVMKQQGHGGAIHCLAYSPDGRYVVTGGDDGKVKLWNTASGFCTVTFDEHSATVSGVLFSRNRKFVASASLDGTVRAYDLARYRNFRTLTSPRPVQFSCVALDASDEFLAAGGQDVFDVYLWSVKVGSLLEVLSGHEGPVSSLAFSPSSASATLASVSWDGTLKLWSAIESGLVHETVRLTADGLCVAFRPDGQELAVATLDGQISFFDRRTSDQTGAIEGRQDLGGGRADADLVTARQSSEGKAFTTLCYTADGACVLAAGSSKNVCIYDVRTSILLKRFEITRNRSFAAVDDFVNRRNMTEFGNLNLVEGREETEGGTVTLRLPGVRRGDMASRSAKPEVRVFSLQFSPTGQAWAAATTEGLMIYSLDANLVFDPFLLGLDVTTDAVRETLRKGDLTQALMMALKLNETELIQRVVESVPHDSVALTVRNLPEVYIERVLKHVAFVLESTRHVHFYLIWIEAILTSHGHRFNSALQLPTLLAIRKNVQRKYDDLNKICDFNRYTLRFLNDVGKVLIAKVPTEDEEGIAESTDDENEGDVEMDSDRCHSDVSTEDAEAGRTTPN
ncbi:periodic tryptophan protein 2 homolog [Orussus abietinus]|uniref:periodic tryptophan protein 2 homolog n=1 Tax=Orussus abietinus TaxID=222816 RepID=UPI00062578F0|nr:periodic tryptophan protein 2 homolog [Orussus abietinus]XP_023289972.1 periodic tryptophan protein 2 homolog [Orussus abietinus]